ncbi:hypothetical protein SteCoe_1286 [Stentor coeruleus]|uniref:Uncharacterized protein n=1 Tax=Stentor coeruleus TaxID=5963 RepID=A0A1R2D268_9CILI|nr:hypothetical protein SteCoe_1286 [Stentor coeruleus]
MTSHPASNTLKKPIKELIDAPINLKDKVLKLNKTLYKIKPEEDKISKLEKETIRGECAVKPEAKVIHKPKRNQDLLSKLLKSEHKTTGEGTQILKLPKLPYGNHKSYNEEPRFRDKHFLDGDRITMTHERIKELEELTRKFRLLEKKYKASKQNRMHSATPLFSDLAFYDVYDMGPGKLVCGREDEVIRSYEKDKEKYKETAKGNYAYTYKDINREDYERKYARRKIMGFKDQQELISRLMPNKEVKNTDMSQFYSTKYSLLFDSFEMPPNIEFRKSSMT